MKFSICIPNYNYASYVGRTIQSVLDQDHEDFEVLVSDNASTDDSVAVVKGLGDPRVRVTVNECNVGFAGNLDRAARDATGDVMIMLSSDDLMRPGALRTYGALYEAAGERSIVVTSAVDVIDADDRVTGRNGMDTELWAGAARPDRDGGPPTHELDAGMLLRRSLRTMRNPFYFLATAYPTDLYRRLEGYGAGRLMNPDKWFHWRLLTLAHRGIFVDEPLFAYRWHASNQTAVQSAQGALKFLIDDYTNTFEFPGVALDELGLDREELVDAFVEYDVARHGLATLARGDRVKARRIVEFGRGAYPEAVRRNRKALALRALLALGPAGTALASRLYQRSEQRGPALAR